MTAPDAQMQESSRSDQDAPAPAATADRALDSAAAASAIVPLATARTPAAQEQETAAAGSAVVANPPPDPTGGGEDATGQGPDRPEEIATLRRQYFEGLKALLSRPASNDKVQTLSARLAAVGRRLGDDDDPAYYRLGLLAIGCLTGDRPNIAAAAHIVADLEFHSSRNSPIFTVMRGLMLSVACSMPLILVILGGYVMRPDIHINQFIQANSGFFLAGAFGMLGGVVSLLMRIGQFDQANRKSRQFLFLTGMSLPVVGLVIAMVVAAMFLSGIINLNFTGTADASITANGQPYFFIVIGFLSGFSERFATGLLDKAGNAVSGNGQPPAAGGQTSPRPAAPAAAGTAA